MLIHGYLYRVTAALGFFIMGFAGIFQIIKKELLCSNQDDEVYSLTGHIKWNNACQFVLDSGNRLTFDEHAGSEKLTLVVPISLKIFEMKRKG